LEEDLVLMIAEDEGTLIVDLAEMTGFFALEGTLLIAGVDDFAINGTTSCMFLLGSPIRVSCFVGLGIEAEALIFDSFTSFEVLMEDWNMEGIRMSTVTSVFGCSGLTIT
jgi:hypothetical protein